MIYYIIIAIAGGEDARHRDETHAEKVRGAYTAAANSRAAAVGRSVGRPAARRIQFPYMAFAYGKIGGNGSLARPCVCKLL